MNFFQYKETFCQSLYVNSEDRACHCHRFISCFLLSTFSLALLARIENDRNNGKERLFIKPKLARFSNRTCGSFKSKSKGFVPSWTTLYAQCTHVQLSVLYGTTYVILSELECSRQEAWHTLCLEQLCCCTVAPYSSLCTLAHSQLFVLSWRTTRARLA